MAPGEPKIRIEVDSKNRDVTCRPASFHAKHNEPITWACEGNPIAIQFIEVSPLEWASSGHHDGVIAGTVQNGIRPGTYKYACAAYIAGQVYMDAACPALIIDP